LTLRGTGSDGLPREGTSVEVIFSQSFSGVTFVWDGGALSEDSVVVRVRADGFGLTVTQEITLKGFEELDHFEVRLEPDTVAQGDAVKVSVIPKDQNDNIVTIEDETPLDFSLDDAGASLGKLVTPDGKLTMIAYASVKDIGTTILTFVANEAPPPALATVARNVKTLIVLTPSATAAQVTEDPPAILGVATIKIQKTADPSKKGSGIVTVKKPRIPTKIELSVSSDQVQHSETIVLKVSLRDKDGVDGVIPPGDGVWGINFFLGAEGAQFGNLNNTATGADAVTLNDVPYKQASDGSITFVADGAAYDGRFPLGISVGASVAVGGNVYTDVKGIYLRGPLTLGTLFLQGNSSWADSLYDSDTTKIGKKGCALSCIAMVLKAYGVDVNPGTLNAWMKENKKYKGESVKWETLRNYSGNSIKDDEPSGEGLGYDKDKKQVILPETLPSLSPMDATLSRGFPVIVQVLNPDSGNQHWVIVTGKTSSGDYKILDPGGKTNRTTLSGSYKTIYRYVPILSK